MKIKHVLVTGGAGFIGSQIVDLLINVGYKVTILDNLDKQIHKGKVPVYLNPKAKFIKASITNKKVLPAILKNIDAVYHEASVVGVGQSMYEIERYVYNNSYGTAVLLDFLANSSHKVKRLIVASSMSAYGEGLYRCAKCGLIRPSLRTDEQMNKKQWELKCSTCKLLLVPVPTPESEKFICNSVYAVTKQTQEDLFMIFGKSYGIPTTAFRYFNVYGPRQSLSNPYTGVAAIFLSRLKNNQAPVIYEDGLQSRDFISVYDIARANILALENKKSFNKVFNLGAGNPKSIKDIALILAQLLDKNISPNIIGQFRSGDVRHCYADISDAKKYLSWSPHVKFEDGMIDLIKWGEGERAIDLFNKATKQLQSKGLLKS